MGAIRSGIYLATSTAIKLILGLIAMKVIAHYIGASGFGMLGQFMSLMSIITITAGGGITNGIISRISESENDVEKINTTMSSGLIIGVSFSCLFGLVLFVNSSYLSTILFDTEKFSYVVKILAISQIFLISSTLLGGYLNGLQKSKIFSILTIISSIIGAVGLILLVYLLTIEGAMIGLIWMAIAPGMVFLLYYLIKIKRRINIVRCSNTIEIKHLLKYSVMLISSACLIPIAQIFIRDIILKHSNWESVGFWQSSMKISDSGLQFITVILTNYYLPEIGKNKTKFDLKKLIGKTYVLLIIVTFVYVIFIHFSKLYLIPLLFSAKFLPASDLLTWQAIGDSLRILSYVVGFVIVSKANLKLYLLADLLIVAFLSFFSYLLIPCFGVIGANYAYCLTYLITFTVGLFFMFVYLNGDE